MKHHIKSCPECGHGLKAYKGTYNILLVCHGCWRYISKDKEINCCHSPKLEKVKFWFSPTGFHVREQCTACGNITSNAIKKDGLNLSILPDADHDKRDQRLRKIDEEYFNMYKWVKDQRDQGDKQTFFEEYNKYLKSDEWLAKRAVVLKRDKYICQSCLTQKATQVHHLTYRHVYNEPLFDLVAVCKPCHDIITIMDRREWDIK
jgi:hypothetical protein